MKLRMACVSFLTLSITVFATPLRIVETKDIDFKFTACQMNGKDLDAYFGDQKKLSDGYLLHFKIKNFSEVLKENSQSDIPISSAITQASLTYTDQDKWEKPESCKGIAHIEPNGIYFTISCLDLIKTKGKKSEVIEKMQLSITKEDRLVCFPTKS